MLIFKSSANNRTENQNPNYYIIGTDYDNYASVYDCVEIGGISGKSAWILTREKQPDQTVVSTCHFTILIHSADQQSRLVGIIVFAHVICPSVHTFKNLAKLFATGETVALAEWIIDDTCLVSCL